MGGFARENSDSLSFSSYKSSHLQLSRLTKGDIEKKKKREPGKLRNLPLLVCSLSESESESSTLGVR